MTCLFYFPDLLTEQGNVAFGFVMWQSKVKTGVGSEERKIVDKGIRMKLSRKGTRIQPSRKDTWGCFFQLLTFLFILWIG